MNRGAASKVRSYNNSERTAAIAQAVEALSQEGLIVIPTETVYGLTANAASAQAVAKLAAATAGSRNGTAFGPVSWHAPSREMVLELLKPETPVQRRMLGTLLPGPVTFIVELAEERLRAVRKRLGTAPGIVDDGRGVCVRVPDHDATQELLHAAWKAGVPVIAQSIAAAGWGDGMYLPPTPPTLMDQMALIIDDGPTRFGRPSTRVRLLREDGGGGFVILSQGALEERAIRKAMERTILFVCSGNTCRSPMAAAIARSLIHDPAGTNEPTTRVRSAGASAGDGDPMTPESAVALRALGVEAKGIDDHRSRGLTRQMIADADVIYTMTVQHARQVRSLDPTAADKIKLLDPNGQDVPDPIGAAQTVYTRTAGRLRELIRKRLAELGP